MAGGLIQLLAWGSQNIKLNGNPSITFFKKVYKAHSNFSMESIRVNLNRTDVNIYDNTVFKTKIQRNGDLVQQVYFVFEVPDIYPTPLEFKWIQHLGEAIIDNYYVTVGGAMVDRQYGEFLHISNQISLGGDKREIYDKMIGNVPELMDPQFRNGFYPQNGLKSRKIYVPLNFWFNRDPGTALPLVAMQYSEIEITIELRPLMDLYQVLSNGSYRAPNKNIPNEQLSRFVNNSTTRYLISDTVLDIKAYLEVNYYFVDTKEREYIAYNTHEYLVEQVTRIERFNLVENNLYDLVLQNPVKEFIWVLKRDDLKTLNHWFDFTDEYESIMKSAKLLFNGMDRMDEKDEMYFNYVQPFQHHKSNPKDGIFVYSFAISPDEWWQPTGSCNMSRVNKIQMLVRAKKPRTYNYNFNMTLYVVNYNFLKISSGLAGVVFSS
jgi:hypothetical protein